MTLETKPEEPLSPAQVWILAARPKTLPAAAAPVIAASAAAFYEGVFSLGPALAALLGALLLQIGANFANDVFDYGKGADTEERLGPLRVTQAGLLRPEQVKAGMWVTFALAALIGLYLIAVAGWPVVVIGLASILAAIAYTGGPYPLGYNGLGEVFVFLFFGVAAVCGTYFVQAGTVSALAGWTSVPMGLLIVNILVVNNLRDIATDRAAGKRTVAVRIGAEGARWEFAGCLALSYLVPLVVIVLGLAPAWVLLSWLSLPLAAGLVRKVWALSGRPLNQVLAGSGRLALVFSLLYGLGLLIGSL